VVVCKGKKGKKGKKGTKGKKGKKGKVSTEAGSGLACHPVSSTDGFIARCA
jgi:hypothetical protein